MAIYSESSKALVYTLPPAALDVGRAVRAWWRSRGVRRTIAANSQWRQTYAGGRVFVLGNGPSLADFDRSALSGEMVIVMNSFDRCAWKNDVNIVAHCIGEHQSSQAWSAKEISSSINGTHSASYWLDISSYLQIGCIDSSKSVHYVLPVFEPGLWGARPFELHAPTLAYQTTAQLAIQVAIYMGFEEVLLVGFDHDWLASRDYLNHFYSMEKDATDSIGTMRYLDIINFMQRMWTIYYSMRAVAERAGVTVVNLSSTTCLDVFERREVGSYLACL